MASFVLTTQLHYICGKQKTDLLFEKLPLSGIWQRLQQDIMFSNFKQFTKKTEEKILHLDRYLICLQFYQRLIIGLLYAKHGFTKLSIFIRDSILNDSRIKIFKSRKETINLWENLARPQNGNIVRGSLCGRVNFIFGPDLILIHGPYNYR